MNIKRLGWSAFAAASGCVAAYAIAGAVPSLAQMPAQSGASPSQTPGLGAHAPHAEGQPSWMEGMTGAQKDAPLHPNVPNMLGHPGKDIPVQNFKLPTGFKIELYAGDMQEARSMTLGAKGTVFVGERTHDAAFAITEKGGNREVKKILTGLNSPNGVAFSNGTLYVAERERILAYDGIEDHLDSPPQTKVVIEGLPHQDGHFWKFMVMGPDGWLYFNQGSPTSLTMPSYVQAVILRVNTKTHIMEVYARGVCNSVGMAFHPETGRLYFTDNGRDWLGEDMPSDEFNRATAKDQHFGYS
ncbi:MAG TPA: hypothetical protein VHW66_12275 [Stellaceae bacterium]|jgi:glucose/arabinose dehydrogenase|nr:hypothetical protein [Stellaceae bacterium]